MRLLGWLVIGAVAWLWAGWTVVAGGLALFWLLWLMGKYDALDRLDAWWEARRARRLLVVLLPLLLAGCAAVVKGQPVATPTNCQKAGGVVGGSAGAAGSIIAAIVGSVAPLNLLALPVYAGAWLVGKSTEVTCETIHAQPAPE